MPPWGLFSLLGAEYMIRNKKCKKCGHENQMENRYCSKCGTAFRNMISLGEIEENVLSNNSAIRGLLIVVILLVIISSVIVVLAMAILRNSFSLAQKSQGTVIQETIQTDMTTDTVAHAASAGTPADKAAIAGTLQPHPTGEIYSGFRYAVFDSGISRNEIRTITFWGSKDLAPLFAWDVSEERDESVVAWVEGNGDGYDLYIAANGRIRVRSCFELFAFYSNVEEINFNGVLDTSQATDMSRMFQCCDSLTELDLSTFDTSCVTDMEAMFEACGKLANLNLSGFDTAQVTNVVGMFRDCRSLTNLDLSGFNSSNVQYYSEFMDEGVTVNGVPWEQLF